MKPTSPNSPSTISFVQPIDIKAKTTAILPPSINGLRLPNLDVDLSDKAPTIGCVIKPRKKIRCFLIANLHYYSLAAFFALIT